MNTYSHRHHWFILSIGLFAAALLSGCKQSPKPIHIDGQAQGTYYSITYYDDQHRNLQPQIDSILNDFDQTASLWVDSSLLRRINANRDSIINPLFADLLNKSVEINRYTNGSFDCTVGNLVRAWGFSFQRGNETLDEAEIEQMRHYMSNNFSLNYDSVSDKTILHKPFPETEIDFNAIAQGYSVDMVGDYLLSLGIENFIIDIGGEVLAKGNKPDGTHWSVGIERPAADKYDGREVETVISLQDRSVVTSGSYRKYYEKDGVRYSHTIDPTTGHPVEHNLLSASVVADEAWRADALATAFMVMGLDQSLQFMNEHPEIEAAFFIYNEGGNYKTLATKGFEKLIKE